ncbi:MAG: beta-galactosidase [Verrucomicrobia bacterium]|nr:beta-galactosidase [Verrucomicrobiota bacterium]
MTHISPAHPGTRSCAWSPALVVAGLSMAFASMPATALTVRVDPAGGAPRIVVDGNPVRARMFWGSPGSSPLPVPSTGTPTAFEFVAIGGATNGTMHFRFGATAGEVVLDDIRIVDLDSKREVVPLCDFEDGTNSFRRDWTFWPPRPANTVGAIDVVPGAGRNGTAGLRVTLKPPASGPWPDFHIYHHPRLTLEHGRRYRVEFWIRGEPARKVSVALYRPGDRFEFVGGPQSVFESQIRLAAAAGVRFVSFPVPLPWPRPGEAADWTGLDAACRRVLDANPGALLIPRVPMDPPAWWREANPDDVMKWENGRRDKAVPASPRYRRDAAARLAALVGHLESTLGESVAGYHPNGQNTGEWFYQDTWLPPLSGYAPADAIAWRTWLRTKYGTDDALRRAWGRPDATLDEAPVPPAAERHASPAGTFRDPVRERHLIDFAAYQQDAMADCVCELARAVRTASHGRKLVVFFFGYLFEFAPVANGPAVSGHYASRRVIDCPDIDVLCAPISYHDRGLGGNAPAMSAAESVALAGKLWLNEDDTHTYLATGTPPGARDHVDTLEETNGQLVRNVAQEALRNFGTWWMDLGSSGWFDDAGMWREMRRLKALDDPLLKHPTPFRPEVAVVVGERAMLRVTPKGSAVTRRGIYEARTALGRMGAPYGQYLLDDVLAGRVHAKLYVMLNAWDLSAADRRRLLDATRGAARVWCYAPGHFEGDTVAPQAMRDLTGFRLEPVTPVRGWAEPTAAGRTAGLAEGFGLQAPVLPLFAAQDATGGEILAVYPDGSAAVALRRGAEGASLFSGAPGLTSSLLRIAAREAGVHLFTTNDCNVYANAGYVALHASQDGPVDLNTGRDGEISDVLTGGKAGHGPVLRLDLKRGETRVLKY